jgi:hypothetical protein
MGKAKTVIKWMLSVCALLGAVWISLVLYDAAVESNPFFTTPSPGGTYTVELTGQKRRPLFFTNTVNYHVLKNGQPFIQSTYIHSGDFMDISFELAYPNHRWVSGDTLQLYREQYFNDGRPDTLVVVNRAGQVIKHLKVASQDQFLFFDLQPGTEMKLLNSRPRGDYKGIDVVGEFYDGRRINSEETLRPGKELSDPFTYYIYINADGATFEGPK